MDSIGGALRIHKVIIHNVLGEAERILKKLIAGAICSID